MAYLQQKPNSVFPFRVVGRKGETSLQYKAIYDLYNIIPLDGGINHNEVQVTDISCTSFTFTSVGGFDPGGGTITFRTYEKNGVVYLEQEAHTEQMCFLFFCCQDDWTKNGAENIWRQQAANLKNAFYGKQGVTPSPGPRPTHPTR